MISDRLLSVVRCPDCRGVLSGTRRLLTCAGCARRFSAPSTAYLDLQPEVAYGERTKYLDEALHADARHETVSPPLLSAGVRQHMLRKFLELAPSDRVIDLGCGSGRALVWNQPSGAYLIGTDVSPHFAAEACDGVDLTLADLRRLPFAAATFTKAYSLDVLEHLSPAALAGMLEEAARVLVPGGALFVYSHVRRNSSLALGLRAINGLARALERVGLIDLTQERLRKSDHLNPLADVADLHRTARAAGLRVARIRYYTPLIGGLVENVLVRLAERVMTRRAARRAPRLPAQPAAPSEAAAIRAARAEAKRWIAAGGVVRGVLTGLTWIMRLDIALFGRVTSGPFFALLVKDVEPAERGVATRQAIGAGSRG